MSITSIVYYINCLLHQLSITSIVYYINCLLHQLSITSIVYYIYCLLHQLSITSIVYYINCLLHQLSIPSIVYTINCLLHLLSIASIVYYIYCLYHLLSGTGTDKCISEIPVFDAVGGENTPNHDMESRGNILIYQVIVHVDIGSGFILVSRIESIRFLFFYIDTC